MKPFGIGLLGCGTIGSGVVEVLHRQRELIRRRTGFDLRLVAVADPSPERLAGLPLDGAATHADGLEVVRRPDVDIVVELIGGVRIARQATVEALRLGKTVVTANKHLLADHGRELWAAAQQAPAGLFFEASVAGGIPLLKAVREGLVANRIRSVRGILNGTCNYILTAMQETGAAYADVLAEAQAKGYAEKEPALDVDGIDTAHKVCVLAALAFGCPATTAQLPATGISALCAEDIRWNLDWDHRIKLLGLLEREGDLLRGGVSPVVLHEDSLLAKVDGVFNAVLVEGDIVGQTLYYGRGAGRLPTASAVVSDIVDAAAFRLMPQDAWTPRWPVADDPVTLRPLTFDQGRFYARFDLPEGPALAEQAVRAALARHRVPVQALQSGGFSPGSRVGLLTGECRRKTLESVAAEVGAVAAPLLLPVRSFTSG
jgi:homoserine dehydrogenase